MVEQTINISALLEFFGLVLTIIVSAIIITRAIKKGYKTYIDNKLEVMDARVIAIEDDLKDYKKQNEKEHDRFIVLFDSIDGKLTDILSRLPNKK